MACNQNSAFGGLAQEIRDQILSYCLLSDQEIIPFPTSKGYCPPATDLIHPNPLKRDLSRHAWTPVPTSAQLRVSRSKSLGDTKYDKHMSGIALLAVDKKTQHEAALILFGCNYWRIPVFILTKTPLVAREFWSRYMGYMRHIRYCFPIDPRQHRILRPRIFERFGRLINHHLDTESIGAVGQAFSPSYCVYPLVMAAKAPLQSIHLDLWGTKVCWDLWPYREHIWRTIFRTVLSDLLKVPNHQGSYKMAIESGHSCIKVTPEHGPMLTIHGFVWKESGVAFTEELVALLPQLTISGFDWMKEGEAFTKELVAVLPPWAEWTAHVESIAP